MPGPHRPARCRRRRRRTGLLDAPDVAVLVKFYSELRGWAVYHQDDEDASLDLGEGVAYLNIQRNEDYVRPVWPARPGAQQMMLHRDFEVTDLEAETQRALQLGAELASYQPQDNVRVLFDPAGHPFCLFTGWGRPLIGIMWVIRVKWIMMLGFR